MKPSHIVEIGASANGLEAIYEFFDNTPADTGMAFVVIQHLSPEFKSLMWQLLPKHAKIPVSVVEAEVEPVANHI